MTELHEPTLASLMVIVGARYPTTNKQYPHADLGTPEKVKTFGVSHSSKHIGKTAGKIATEVEAYDHGVSMNEESLRIATAQMLINTLKLAEVLGMSPRDLVMAISKLE